MFPELIILCIFINVFLGWLNNSIRINKSSTLLSALLSSKYEQSRHTVQFFSQMNCNLRHGITVFVPHKSLVHGVLLQIRVCLHISAMQQP